MTKLNNDGHKFIKYMVSKGSLIIKDYTKTIDDIYNLKDIDNLFISLNGYQKGTKTREQKNINSLNFFFLDIDLKDNLNYSKDEIKEKIFEYENDFTFIIESKNGFHLYIEIDNKKYKKINGDLDFENYTKDWKTKLEYYNNLMDLNFDSNATKTSQIARIPGSFHAKDSKDKFKIKLLKGKNILEKSTIDIINEIPIKEVFDKLGVEYNKDTLKIYEDNQETNGWSINEELNYVNDFSNKNRATGGPFSYVLNYFISKNGKTKYEKNLIDTYNFFKYNFGIVGKSQKTKNIKINKIIANNLLRSNLSHENIKYFLLIQYYMNQNNINDGMDSDFISINEFKNFIGDNKIKKTTILTNLRKLEKNSNMEIKRKIKSRDGGYIKSIKIINIIIKNDNGIKLKFNILPGYKYLEKNIYDSKFFHFLNKNILNIKLNNNKILHLYLYLHEKLILGKRESIFLTNEIIDNFKINKNLSLRNKRLNELGKTLGNFIFTKKLNEGFEIKKL